MWYLESFTYADMYNVVGHEFGHCLGLFHADEGHDLMAGTYPHQVGHTTALHCPSNVDVKALTYAFGAAMGHPPPGDVPGVPAWGRYMLRDACE
jgi:hypothetical protein